MASFTHFAMLVLLHRMSSLRVWTDGKAYPPASLR